MKKIEHNYIGPTQHPYAGYNDKRAQDPKDERGGWCCMECKEHGSHSRLWCSAGCCDR